MDYKAICQDVISLTRETAEFIEREKYRLENKDIEFKAKNDLVSYVDVETEKKLIKGLHQIIPDSKILGEETEKAYDGKGFTWVIDPIDGTTNFIHQLPVYCTSIALMKDDELVAGVVLEINRNECFYAWKNGGAWLDDKPIKVSETADLGNSLVATGFPYTDFDFINVYVDFLKEMMLDSRGLRRLGSAAVDLCYTACGRFDAFYEFGLKPWDVAAGALIVKEAGGTVTDFSNNDNYLFGREILAGTDPVVNIIQKRLQNHLNKQK